MESYALIGEKLSHSISPFIHRRLFELNKVTADYSLAEIARKDFDSSVLSLSRLCGFNVTIPYKTDIIRFLDGISEPARQMGAVNTVSVKSGKFYGYNTDIDGFLWALKSENISLHGNVLILGSGGFSRMAVYSAAKAGCNIFICSRNKAATDKIISEMSFIFPNVSIEAKESVPAQESFDLIINGTPVGMQGCDTQSVPVSQDVLLNCRAYFDAIYNPLETVAVKMLKKAGIPAVSGLSMLVLQAAKAQEIWRGVQFNEDDLKRIIGESADII